MIAGVDEKTGQPLALNRIPKKTLSRDDFILLFIKQLQFQDPMKPIENNEMAMQMALFSQVDQLFKLNEGFEEFMQTVREQRISLLSSLVGREVKIKGDYGRVEEGRFLGGEFELEEPAGEVSVAIYDEKGREIKRLELGALPVGKHHIEWDATDKTGQTVPDGNYRIKILVNGRPAETTLWVYGRVTGALLGDEARLVINGENHVKPEEIEEILL